MLAGTAAHAQSYPAGPIRLVVPGAMGSVYDIAGRLLARQLGQQLGAPITIDNQAGENGVTAADTVAKSAPDGQVLVIGNEMTMATSMHLKKKFPYDPLAEFTPIAGIAEDHYALIAASALPVNNLAELIEYAKNKKIAYTSGGDGTTSHLAGALFNERAGLAMLHFPRDNIGKATDALFAGEAQIMFVSAVVAKRHAAAGKVKVLGVADPAPYAALPDVPAIAATLPGFQVNGWFALFAPASLPPAITARLSEETGKAVSTGDLKSRMGSLMLFTPLERNSEQMRALLKSEIELRGKLVKGAKLEAE